MTASKVMKTIGVAFAVFVIASIVVKAYVAPVVEEAAKAGEGQSSRADGTLRSHASEVKLSKQQEEEVSAYSDATLETAELLEANDWVNEDGSQLVFGRGYYVFAGEAGEASAGAFVLGKPSTVTGASGGKVVKTTTCPVAVGDDLALLNLVRTVDGEGEQIYVRCDALGNAKEYDRANASREVTVERPERAVYELAGGDEAFPIIAREIGEYVARRYPSALTASWDATASVDYGSGSVQLGYRLDDRSQSRLKVLVPIGGGEPQITSG